MKSFSTTVLIVFFITSAICVQRAGAQEAPGPESDATMQERARMLGLDSLDSEATAYYSPGYDKRAQELAALLRRLPARTGR